jgi:hypothetical protein
MPVHNARFFRDFMIFAVRRGYLMFSCTTESPKEGRPM